MMKKINDQEIISELATNLYSCERIMGETYIKLSKELSKSNAVVLKIKSMTKQIEKFRSKIDDEIAEYISSELLDKVYKDSYILYNCDQNDYEICQSKTKRQSKTKERHPKY